MVAGWMSRPDRLFMRDALGLTMFDVEVRAGRFEGVAEERHVLRPHGLDVLGYPAIANWIG